MGKKKRPVDNAAPTAIPLFYEKKKKLDAETSLTAMIALHKYCARFKLGAPGFRQKNINPFVITVVMGDNEHAAASQNGGVRAATFGTGQHRSDREKAMEQAALVTLR